MLIVLLLIIFRIVEIIKMIYIYIAFTTGTIPMEEEGTVDRKACMSFFGGDCCHKQYPIKMKHCSTFLVYWLATVDSCPLMYCFGSYYDVYIWLNFFPFQFQIQKIRLGLVFLKTFFHHDE